MPLYELTTKPLMSGCLRMAYRIFQPSVRVSSIQKPLAAEASEELFFFPSALSSEFDFTQQQCYNIKNLVYKI